MPKMTKAQTAKLDKLIAERNAASDAVYAAAAPRNDVKFRDCLTMASRDVADRYLKANADMRTYEWTLVFDLHRGYWDTFNHFQPYTA